MLATALLCVAAVIFDGDSFIARCPTVGAVPATERVEVRIGPIDAPEHDQPYGTQAKQALTRMIANKTIQLDCYKQDRYGRRVCNVWAPPAATPHGAATVDVGLAMVRSGSAWWYRHYAREQTPQARTQYRNAENAARSTRTGLWAARKPVPPWNWRRSHPRKRHSARH